MGEREREKEKFRCSRPARRPNDDGDRLAFSVGIGRPFIDI